MSRKGRIKRIHVNQHVLKANAKNGENNPFFTVKCSTRNHYGHRVVIDGPSELVSPEKPLSCGAKAWIETRSPVHVITHTACGDHVTHES